jgi:hypothetical protein
MSAPNRVAPALGDEALNQDLEGVLTMVRNGAHDDRNGAHDEPECCSRWGRNGAHNEPEWVLTMARNTHVTYNTLSAAALNLLVNRNSHF